MTKQYLAMRMVRFRDRCLHSILSLIAAQQRVKTGQGIYWGEKQEGKKNILKIALMETAGRWQ